MNRQHCLLFFPFIRIFRVPKQECLYVITAQFALVCHPFNFRFEIENIFLFSEHQYSALQLWLDIRTPKQITKKNKIKFSIAEIVRFLIILSFPILVDKFDLLHSLHNSTLNQKKIREFFFLSKFFRKFFFKFNFCYEF